jgi:remodeling and spacing factor 1
MDMHIRLLRKAKKHVKPEAWEKAVIKFAHSYSHNDAWDLERFGYKKARLSVKLNVLKVWSTPALVRSN